MQKNAAIMELMQGYDAYAEAGELSVGAEADAPASITVTTVSITSLPCIYAASAASSVPCAAFSGGVAATVVNGC
ncbi:LxmA leader domain family RiPP [Nocardiopsis aegyptia]|uniref:LxmA leader domain family RiPP n=1 Tax=Nocardiopsis aegyptia TaxID=220378 RepID=UPI00366FEDDF